MGSVVQCSEQARHDAGVGSVVVWVLLYSAVNKQGSMEVWVLLYSAVNKHGYT